MFWAVCLCAAQVVARGEQGKRTLFVLPAVLFVVSIVIFPILFGLSISFTDWNLSAVEGRKFNGLDNIRQMWGDPFYWNALRNMAYYTLAILVEYAIAFGLALLLNEQIRARKFFRVAFLLPLMLSPVAVSWMVGKSMMEIRFGPLARFARELGWDTPSFFGTAEIARTTIMAMDAWTYNPVHDDHDPRRAAGDPPGGAGGGPRRRRVGLAGLLAGDLPADAAGCRSPRS